jgi:YHS domain-containing protein
MKLLFICCGVLTDEMEAALLKTGVEGEVLTVSEHLHLEPEKLKIEIQKILDEMTYDYKAVVLVFGLCGGALNGIKTNGLTVIVPKVHDCISFFLGSAKKYSTLFSEYGGKAYWFTKSFLKQGFLPTPQMYEKKRAEFAEQFDEDSADYLVEMEKESLLNYHTCSVVDDKSCPCEELEKAAKACADAYGWTTHCHEIQDEFFIKIASGEYDEDEFLIVPPFKTIVQSNDENILTYQ